MTMPFGTLFSLCILLQGATLVFCEDDVFQAEVGNLTDDVLAGLERFAMQQDITAVNLPDVQQDFTVPLWILTFSGSINLTEGSLRNFTVLKRYGDSRLMYVTANDQFVIQTGVEIPNLQASYDFAARAGVVKQSGKIQVSVSGTKATLLADLNTQTLKLGLADFKVADLGIIKVKVEDGVVGVLASAISNVVAKMTAANLRQLLQTQIPPFINELLDKFDLASLLKPPSDLVGGQ